MGPNDINSLSHTKWNSKYHIVFALKHRQKVYYQEKKTEVGKKLQQLCEWKGVRIIEAEACPDHVRLLAEIPLKKSVSSFMGYLKKSSAMLYEQLGELKYKYRSREFWCGGYLFCPEKDLRFFARCGTMGERTEGKRPAKGVAA